MEYGNGFNQNFGWFFSNWGPSFREEGPGGWGKTISTLMVQFQDNLDC